MKKIKLGTVCSGIGSPEVAITRLAKKHKFELEEVFACDIDKHAKASFLANFNPKDFYSDMTSDFFHENASDTDLFVGGIPCQAFSLAGRRLGELDKRGLVFYDFYRYVKEKQPKVFVIENVKGLLSDNKGKTFQNWLQLLGRSVNQHEQMFIHPDSLEYNLHHTVLNSKDFGVPQNRERVFIVGIRKDLPNNFRFPKGFRLEKRLKDVLEKNVNKKYFLSKNLIENLIEYNKRQKENNNGFSAKFRDIEGIMDTLKVGGGGKDDLIAIPLQDINEPKIMIEGEVTPNSQAGKVYNVNGLMASLTAGTHGYAQGYILDPLVVAFGRSDEEKKRRKEHFQRTGQDSGSFKDKSLILKQQDYYDTLLANPNPQKEGLIAIPFNFDGLPIKEATKQGFALAKPYDSINFAFPNSKDRRGRIGDQIANTLETQCNQAVMVPILIEHRGHKNKEPRVITDGIVPTLRAESHGHETKVIEPLGEPELTQILQLPGFESEGRVYDGNGLARTIKDGGGGGG